MSVYSYSTFVLVQVIVLMMLDFVCVLRRCRLPPIVKEAPNTPEQAPTPPPLPQKDTRYVPYSDEPPPSPDRDVAPTEVLEQQRLLMEGA